MWFEVPLSIGALLAFFLVAAPAGAGSTPPELARPRVREVTCGGDLAITDVHPRGDRGDESVTIESHDPIPIDLTGWFIQVGRRRARLDGHIATFATPLTIASPPLRNDGGEATLVDPCDLTVARMRWGAALEHASETLAPARAVEAATR